MLEFFCLGDTQPGNTSGGELSDKAGVNWRILQISREIREPGVCIKQELTVGEASKQVAEAVNQGSLGTCVVPSNYGISKGTEGAVGLCARGVSLIPKEIGRHRGKIRQVSA